MSKTDTDSVVAADPERSPISLTWILSLGVIVVAIASAVIAIVVTRPADPAPATPPVVGAPPVSTAASAPASNQASRGPCVPVAEAKGGPITAAPETTWNFTDTLALPTTDGGPGVVTGPLATCYTPDTLGALTAAAQIYLRANMTGGDLVRARQTTPDNQLQSDEAKRVWRDNPPQKPWLQLAGFRTGSISNNRVDIALQLKNSEGGTTPPLTFTMVWTGTDWLLGPGSTGDREDTNLITWEGV